MFNPKRQDLNLYSLFHFRYYRTISQTSPTPDPDVTRHGDRLRHIKPCATTPFHGTVSQMMLPQSGQDQFALVVFASPIPMASHPGIRLWKWKQAMGQQWLVGGAITILKNMRSSMGRMTSHTWKINVMFETTNQMIINSYQLYNPKNPIFSLLNPCWWLTNPNFANLSGVFGLIPCQLC